MHQERAIGWLLREPTRFRIRLHVVALHVTLSMGRCISTSGRLRARLSLAKRTGLLISCYHHRFHVVKILLRAQTLKDQARASLEPRVRGQGQTVSVVDTSRLHFGFHIGIVPGRSHAGVRYLVNSGDSLALMYHIEVVPLTNPDLSVESTDLLLHKRRWLPHIRGGINRNAVT